VQAHLADIDTDFLAPIDEPIPSYNADLIDPTARPRVKQERSTRNAAVAALRDVGRVRQANQDSVLAMLSSLPRESSDITMALLIVADGMGGHAGGEVASRLAIRTVTHYVLANLVLPLLDDELMEALQSIMIEAVQEANQIIWDQAQMTHSDMGTTCTAALMLGHGLYIAHVGDSRAYLLTDDEELRPLTADHSTVGRLIEMGQLQPHQAREHPLRNQLYRTIGQQPEVEVDFVYESLSNSSNVLLCSDGLWGMISEEQIRQALTHSPWPQDACQELITLANLAGGEDNISAVVMTLPVAERPRS
jgi:serine/threonine protein phosphatase PrpC